MKYLIFAALSVLSLCASAGDNLQAAGSTATQEAQYDYAQDLDIAKVIRVSNAANTDTECGPVKAQMEYVDSKGVTHKIEYTRLGNGCQNG